ncbi:PLP-dependent cysteine synthase family protein [Phytomonospora endophytica]|uniref:Cysteine synthase A n=1 Tax=Phytomonospora endophytica TaxID=714109 RepID=A0A841FR78_9ACTN|nr:cysteine synthase family protein [Phytomonospora endophytica]MBB6038556.1 cysteine synthase A [Phytomonospora endophytica]GIG69304.1 putative pyridoxal phosphate-dependent protein CysK2 [Phytomonospora endophytica]
MSETGIAMPTVHSRVHRSAAGMVGDTPVLRIAAGPDRGYWAKLEGENPGGIKDRAALHLVRAARQRGLLAPGAPIVESSSGTFGLGLALAAGDHGHPLWIVADPGLEPSVRRLLAAYGAIVDIVTAPDPRGGWQEARRRRVAEILADRPGAWCPDQYHNPDITGAYAPLARELAAQLGRVDVLVCAVGTGGHSAGIHRELSRHSPGVRLVGVDACGSTIFGQPARRRLMRGLGSSIHPRNVAYPRFSEIHWVPASAAVRTSRALARSSFGSGGWSVGAVALVADWLARTHPRETSIVAAFPDGVHRYADTVFNDDYCRAHGLLDQPVPEGPVTLTDPLAEEAVAWSRCATVVDPVAKGAGR